MKKTLIAAAVAAAVAAPSANAGVIIYGKIHNSIDFISGNASGMVNITGLRTSGWQVTSRSSRIGFKGSEDLGNGLKAIWKVEVGYDTANGGAWGGSSRNTYIGLSGDWGTFLVGRHDTPYKMAFYSTGIDMMGDTVADANAIYGFHEVRASNAIAYVSPNFNGLTVAAAIIPGEGNAATLTTQPHLNAPAFNGVLAGNGLTDAYSIGVMYKNNGLKLALGYEDLSFGFFGPAITGWDDKKWFIGAGYSINGFDISVGYQDRDRNARNVGNFDNVSATSWAISAAYNFGNNKIIATYGQMDADEVSNVPAGYRRNWNADAYALGFEHKFSKRTKAYVIYATSEVGIGGAANTFVTPAITSTLGNAPARKGKAGSVGLIHTF